MPLLSDNKTGVSFWVPVTGVGDLLRYFCS